jgi:hypothetical protein
MPSSSRGLEAYCKTGLEQMAHPWVKRVSQRQFFVVSSKTSASSGIRGNLLWINSHQRVCVACLLITRFPKS